MPRPERVSARGAEMTGGNRPANARAPGHEAEARLPGPSASARVPGGASRVRSPLGGLRRLLRVPGAVAAAGRRWLGAGNRPGGLPGVASCARVSLGTLALVLGVVAVPEAVLAQTSVSLVQNTGGSTVFVISFEVRPFDRVVQRFTAGSDATITSVQVWIQKTGGTRGLTVKLMQSGGTYPGEEIFTFDSPDTINNWSNIFTVPDDAGEDAKLEEDTEYFIEMQQDGGSGNHLAWWATGGDEDGLTDWTIDDRVRGHSNGQWYSFGDARARLRIWGFEPDAATGAPTISGTARTGHTLTVDTSEIADTDGLTSVSYTFRWFRVDGNTETDVGTDSTTYTVVPADVGKQIGVEASFTDDGGGEETLTSAAVTVESTPATGAPLVLGTPRTGQTLTADTSAIADVDGLTGVRYAYGWQRVDGQTVTPVGTDSSTYTPVPADVGKRLEVEVTFTDDGGGEETLTSAAVVVENTPASGLPAISGTGRIGEPLSADTSAISDPEGLADVEYRYRWVRVEGTTETPIAGAYASTYTPSVEAGDLGKRLKVVVRFSDDLGDPEVFASVPITIRAAVPAVCPALPDLPAGHAAVWTGTVTVGEVLSQNPESLVGRGFAEASSRGTFRLQAGGALSDRDFDIGERAYNVRAALVGDALVFLLDRRLTDAELATLALHVCGETYAFSEASYSELLGGTPGYTWAAGLDWSGASSRTLHLSKANTPATGAPGISGTTRVGETLRARTDAISDGDGLARAVYSYQWVRVDADGTSNPTDIPGATASTYTLTEEDEGKRVKVAVSFTDDLGFDEGPLASTPVAARAAEAPLTCTAPDIPANHTTRWTGEVTVGRCFSRERRSRTDSPSRFLRCRGPAGSPTRTSRRATATPPRLRPGWRPSAGASCSEWTAG